MSCLIFKSILKNRHETKEYEYKFSVKSNAEIAKNLKGHLMLVTGDMDKNVNPAHTYRMAKALIEAGKDFDMLVIPGAGHGYGSADKYFERKASYAMPRLGSKRSLANQNAFAHFRMFQSCIE